jgi:hypothetical protein
MKGGAMPEKYGPSARAALLVLMLEDREIPNPELDKQFKIRLAPADRAALNADGLLATSEGRPLRHTITDKGIDWCMTDLVEGDAPSRSGPLARANADVMHRVIGYLRQRGLLVEAIRSGTGLESLIRAVYFDLSVKPHDWIRLARIRPKLNGADRADVDAVLLKMMRTGRVHLSPDSNRKMLTEDDHAAAVRIGGEDLHLLAIEES